MMVSLQLFIAGFLGFFISGHTSSIDHAIYLSTMDMIVEDGRIELTVKVFEDDLRDVLRAHHGYLIDTSAVKFYEEVTDYFDDHLMVKGNESRLRLKFISIVRVGDSYQIHFSNENIPPFNGLTIEADYFTELFPTQQNILNLSFNGSKKYHIFKKAGAPLEYKF